MWPGALAAALQDRDDNCHPMLRWCSHPHAVGAFQPMQLRASCISRTVVNVSNTLGDPCSCAASEGCGAARVSFRYPRTTLLLQSSATLDCQPQRFRQAEVLVGRRRRGQSLVV